MESDDPSDIEDIKNEEDINSTDNKEEIGEKSDTENSDDDIEEDIQWINRCDIDITPEKAYEILDKKHPIKMLKEGKKK